MDATKIKVLMVEDVEIAQKIAVHILSKLNCEVTVAGTGQQALEWSQKAHYHLIFMDLGLPDIEGIKVAEAIRHTPNINQKTPIIALTAHSPEADLIKKCVNAGMNDFLTKPLMTSVAEIILNRFAQKSYLTSPQNCFYNAAATAYT